jgi:hypothetical protein
MNNSKLLYASQRKGMCTRKREEAEERRDGVSVLKREEAEGRKRMQCERGRRTTYQS